MATKKKAASKGRKGGRPAGGAKAARTGGSRKKEPPKTTDNPRSEGGELLDMKQAIAMLKTTRPTFYRWLRSGKLKGMKVGRQWRFYREDIERFLRGQAPRIDLPADIGPLTAALRERITEYGAALPEAKGGDEATEAVRLMLCLAASARASDLHVDVRSDGVRIRLRLDGVLHPVLVYDARLHAAIVAAWKSLASCDLHETESPQDGRTLMSLPGIDEPVDFRVLFLPAHGGEAVTARILRRDEIDVSMGRLPLAGRDREVLLRHIESPAGAVVITGPTGSGKTTTLYACLGHVNRPERKVVSVEDPVELSIDGVVQVAVRQQPNRTFPAACRALLRTDPDVIMVGEIRGLETAELTMQMALTGHLVLTTLHTTDAAEGLVRLAEIGVVPFVVADATRLVMAQRLVRKLCPACSKAATPSADELARAAEFARGGGLDLDNIEEAWREPAGCKECRFTGYRYRTMVAELLEVTPEIGLALRREASNDELRAIAVRQGMVTMAACGVAMAARGETSLAEVMRVLATR